MLEKNELGETHDDTMAAKQAYESALDIIADIVLAYLTSEKATKENPLRTGGVGSTYPYPCAPVAA